MKGRSIKLLKNKGLQALIGILLLSCYSGRAQDRSFEGWVPDRRVIFSVTDSSKIKAALGKKEKKVAVDTQVWYASYKKGRVYHSQGDYDGRLLHGAYFEYTRDDALLVKGQYAQGKKQGRWLYWDRAGNLIKVSHWKRGAEVQPRPPLWRRSLWYLRQKLLKRNI